LRRICCRCCDKLTFATLLAQDDRWRRTPAAASLDNDRFRGTAFTWKTTGLMTFQAGNFTASTYT